MASTKKLTQSEISLWAQEVINALGTGVRLEEYAERFSAEPAGTRRDLMEGICQRMEKLRSIQLEPARILQLLEVGLLPGLKQKQDFIDSYIRSVFACAAVLGGEQKDAVCKQIFISMLNHPAQKESLPLLQPSLFHRNAPLIGAMNGALADETCLPLLAGSFDHWCSLISEIVAEGEVNTALTKDALFGLLKLIGARTGRLDNALRLSLPILVSVAKGAPDEFRGSTHARTECLIRESFQTAALPPDSPEVQRTAVQTGENKKPRAAEPVQEFSSNEISDFAATIRQMLLKLDDAIAERLTRQATEIERLRRELQDDKEELEKTGKQVSDLTLKMEKVQEQLRETEEAMNRKQSEILDVKDELHRYKQSHDVLDANLASVEGELTVRLKREFAEHSGRVLSDVRNHLDQYLKTQNTASIRMAVGSFNRLARTLRNEGFVATDALLNIETSADPGDGN
jgi:hypothetical protein